MNKIIAFSSSCGGGGDNGTSSSTCSSDSSNIFIIGPTCGSVVHYFNMSIYRRVHHRNSEDSSY